MRKNEGIVTEETGKETTHASAAQKFESALADGREALAGPFPLHTLTETDSPETIGAELDDGLDGHLPYRAADSLWRINIDFDRKVREIICGLDFRHKSLRIKYFRLRERESILASLRLCMLLAICRLVYLFREELLAALSVPVETIGRALSLLRAPSGPEGLP